MADESASVDTNPAQPGDAAPAAVAIPASAAPVAPAEGAGSGSGGAEVARPRVRKAGRVPSDKQLAKERADEARRASLAKGREKLAAARAAEKSESEPEAPKADPAAFADGARMALQLLWFISGIFARIFGGRLAELTDADLSDGTREALPVLRRFPLVVRVLGFLGFPLWLLRTVKARFERKAAPAPVVKPLALAPAPPPYGATQEAKS